MERTAVHTVAATALALILTPCGTVGSSETSTADPTIEPEPTSGVASTQPSVTTTAGTPTTMEMAPLEQLTLDAFREWTGALAAADYERAWRLIAPSSQAALGSYEFFASLGSEMTEGWGSWAATPDLTISIGEDLAGRLAAVIGGTVEREGMTEDTTTTVFVGASGDTAAVSPFEEFGNVAAGLANPDTTVPLPGAAGSGRRIVYANAAQRVWIVGENDTVVDTYLVSGREGVPAPGIYEVFSKSETASAGHDNITPCRCTTVCAASRN